MTTATLSRRYISLAEAAGYIDVTERTIRNFIARGDLTGYRVGTRAIRVDVRELEAMLTPIPAVQAGGRR